MNIHGILAYEDRVNLATIILMQWLNLLGLVVLQVHVGIHELRSTHPQASKFRQS